MPYNNIKITLKNGKAEKISINDININGVIKAKLNTDMDYKQTKTTLTLEIGLIKNVEFIHKNEPLANKRPKIKVITE